MVHLSHSLPLLARVARIVLTNEFISLDPSRPIYVVVHPSLRNMLRIRMENRQSNAASGKFSKRLSITWPRRRVLYLLPRPFRNINLRQGRYCCRAAARNFRLCRFAKTFSLFRDVPFCGRAAHRLLPRPLAHRARGIALWRIAPVVSLISLAAADLPTDEEPHPILHLAITYPPVTMPPRKRKTSQVVFLGGRKAL